MPENAKHHLLIILSAFAMGGAEHMVYELAKNVDRKSFDVNILCYGARTGSPLENKVEQICKVDYLGLTGHITPFTIMRVLSHISDYKPDVVHAHMGGTVFALLWGILHNKPVITTAHTIPEKAYSSSTQKLVRKMLKRDHFLLVAVSADNQRAMMNYYNVDDKKCAFVNNGIDISRFYQHEHSQFTYINVARQDENKNQIAIIRCFNRVLSNFPESKLVLVGDGPCQSQLRSITKQMNISDKVLFTGVITNPEDYYAESDCYVQASHREAMPLSVLEAMAARLPIIATDVGGVKDIVWENNGFLIPDGKDDILYQKMVQIQSMTKEDRKKYGDVSFKKVFDYSSQKMAQKYEKLYLRIIYNSGNMEAL